MAKRVLPVLLGVVVVGLGIWYFTQYQGSRGGPLQLYGNVDIRQVELGFRVPGRVERMNFEEGDSVAKGALLASLDKQPFLDDVAAREAAVNQAAALLQKLEAGNRPDEIGCCDNHPLGIQEQLGDIGNLWLRVRVETIRSLARDRVAAHHPIAGRAPNIGPSV